MYVLAIALQVFLTSGGPVFLRLEPRIERGHDTIPRLSQGAPGRPESVRATAVRHEITRYAQSNSQG